MTTVLGGLDPGSYRAHRLHTSERVWTETNCYVDLWIEVLHTLGLDPVAGLAFTLATDFEGDQWTMFKYPAEDLRDLYGIDVVELNVWRPLVDHIEEQLGLGRLLTVDVDAWYLPDTAGLTYRTAHQKTTVVPQMCEPRDRRLGYFHNAGYYELSGDDFDGLLASGDHSDPAVLPPYVEMVKIDHRRAGDGDLVREVVQLTGRHLARRPSTNPVTRMRKRVEEDLAWLAEQDMETFHRWAFGICRQCGANAETAASFCEWLDQHDGGGLVATASALMAVANSAKALEFGLARVARGRSYDLGRTFADMEEAWETATIALVARYR